MYVCFVIHANRISIYNKIINRYSIPNFVVNYGSKNLK